MRTILKQFVNESLFDACSAMLNHLHITFNEITRMPVSFEDLYRQPLTKSLQEIMTKVENTYFIGTVDESSLSGNAETLDAIDVTNRASEGKYPGMMLFAVEVSRGEILTRSEMATLTRGFNRIAAAQPVVLFIKQGDKLALATCERSEYTQQWRDGEKLGKVSMLRDINCQNPHRGHIDILNSIGDKAYPTFEELYKHWMQVFSSELLTQKFYGELSDWYAWAVQVARFPNDLATKDDDEKFNHESCIRLITRLIFVWFLKQKHLIPEEFFDERYIREHFIEEFNPHDRENLLYNPEKSRYYRLILQNLFFAMLNRPIVPEGKDTANNRRFRAKGNYHGMNPDYAVNNLMRYESEFMLGGAEEFMKMANSHVPFLNGGLFDCLDDKPKNLYYDGFSERKDSLEQLYLPDWLFFGDEVGRSIDLSEWYGDTKKKKVSASGIIDILGKYNFTIEENTPLDQEVSLDPELLGKAFENLLASYNPETKTSARKQTGSFYTPREIVQYMVDESLVAHLKRTCGEEQEAEYRSLLNYATEETTLNEDLRRQVMQALYHCRVLDPACGSGAFPMGILQQMVHILRQLDPTNEMWKDFMIDLAIEQSKVAFAEDEEAERKARLADIEEAFNKSINDPDYARKLYLIEHCIYGVDIQPIAVQISKLRFFISLVVDQKPTNDATRNFGIRPLPNLESKFVSANTLIPIDYESSLFEDTDIIISLKEQLKELNHRIFLAKRNIDKQRLKDKIKETRTALAKAIEDTGFVNPGAAQQLADWDMFEQNTSSPFFDAEWMFGVKGGFDIVIANPPYIDSETMENTMPEKRKQYKGLYKTAKGNWDIFVIFIERGNTLLCANGVQSYIVPNKLIAAKYTSSLRTFLQTQKLGILRDYSKVDVFEAFVYPCVFVLQKQLPNNSLTFESMSSLTRIEQSIKVDRDIFNRDILWDKFYIPLDKLKIILSISSHPQLSNVVKGQIYGSATVSEAYDIKFLLKEYIEGSDDYLKFINTGTIDKYRSFWKTKKTQYIKRSFVRPVIEKMDLRQLSLRRYKQSISPKLIIAGMSLVPEVFYDSGDYLAGKSTSIILSSEKELKFLVAVLNSKLIGEWFRINFNSLKMSGGYITIGVNEIGLIPIADKNPFLVQMIVQKTDTILERLRENETADISDLEKEIDIFVYHLYNLTYNEILIIDPEIPITREEYESYMQMS